MNERLCYWLSLPCGWLFGMGTGWLSHIAALHQWGPVVSRAVGGIFLFFIFFLPLLFIVCGPHVIQSFQALVGRQTPPERGSSYWRTKLPILFRLALWISGFLLARQISNFK